MVSYGPWGRRESDATEQLTSFSLSLLGTAASSVLFCNLLHLCNTIDGTCMESSHVKERSFPNPWHLQGLPDSLGEREGVIEKQESL